MVINNMATAGVTLLSEKSDEEKQEMRREWLLKGQELIWEKIISRNPVAIRQSSLIRTPNQEQSIAIDLLAEEWLEKCPDLPTKLYLIDSLLPVLVMGLERLLVRVGKKGLEDQEGFRNDFNPINILAQYLMRHNPRYRHCSLSMSSYTVGLNVVASRLRKLVVEGEEGVESRVKRELLERRNRDETALKEKLADEQKKRDTLRAAAILWSGENGIPTLLV